MPKLFVGTYTDKLPFVRSETPGEGIYAYDVDETTGALTATGVCTVSSCGSNPSYLTASADGKNIYATNELYADPPGSTVTSFAVDPSAPGSLKALGSSVSKGTACCHATMDLGGKHLLAANYMSGTAVVFGVSGDDGMLSADPTSYVQHGEGFSFPGNNAARQEGPHAHMMCLSPAGDALFIPELGCDAVIQYKYDSTTGILTPNGAVVTNTAGAGPRHMVFHPTLPVAYVINEMHSTVSVYNYDAAACTLASELQNNVSTLAAGKGPSSDAVSTCAALRIHPSGKFLYGSNRGDDSITLFSIDQKDGTITFVKTIESDPAKVDKGGSPRDFLLVTPTLMLVANQDSNNIHGFKVDVDTGDLTFTGETTNCPTPIVLCVV